LGGLGAFPYILGWYSQISSACSEGVKRILSDRKVPKIEIIKRFPHYKVGRRVLYEDREINSWLDEQKQAAVR